MNVPRPSTLDVFVARCEARAILVRAGTMSMQNAVDGLQDAAMASGLVEQLGQDTVQALLAKAFRDV